MEVCCAANLLEVRFADGSEFGCFSAPSGVAVKLSQLFHGQCFAEPVAGRSEERDALFERRTRLVVPSEVRLRDA